MPVLVTRADLGIGPRLVAALRTDGAEVRAYATGGGDVGSLQAAGAFVAVGDLDDEGHLDAAMTDAHTVIVLTSTWAAAVEDLDTTVPVIARAAVSARVARLVLVSLVGADPDAEVPLLAAHGRAEQALTAAGAAADVQVLVVRTDGVVGDGLRDLVANVAGRDDEILAPVAPERLVAGLVALDAARSERSGGHALFTALGEALPLATWRARLVDGTGEGAAATAEARSTDGGRPSLVGRRWLGPDRRRDLAAALAGRGEPPLAGADLWAFVEEES